MYPEGAAPQQAITVNLSLQLIGVTKVYVTIYTDGSATGGTTAGGAAMVATVGGPADPVIIHTSKAREAELTSSYEEEKAALLLALDWARANCPTERISICSGSQALLKAIQSGAHDTQSIRQRLDNREGSTTLIWVPGHKGIPGNEAADKLAKAAVTATDTPPRPISFATAKALIRRTVPDAPSNRPQTAMVYEHFSWKADCITTSHRADAVLLAHLRAGHTSLLKAYATY